MTSYIVGKDYTEEEKKLEAVEDFKSEFYEKQKALAYEIERWFVLEQTVIIEGRTRAYYFREVQIAVNHSMEIALGKIRDINAYLEELEKREKGAKRQKMSD